jgi:peptide chain release factor subunit 1
MTRDELRKAVKKIAKKGDKEAFFISIYLNTNDKDPNQNLKTGSFLRKSLRTLDKSLPVRGDLRTLFNNQKNRIFYEYENLSATSKGVFFLVDKRGIKKIELQVPFNKSLIASYRPNIIQLEEIFSGAQDFNVLIVDSREAKFFNYSLGNIEFKEKIVDMVPDRVKTGGWSQGKIERHIQDHISNHFKNTALRLEHIYDYENKGNWLILGQHGLVVNFLKFLPKHLKEKVLGTFEMDLRSNINDIAKATEEYIASKLEKRNKKELIKLNNLQSSGLFVWGLKDVLKYANNNAVDQLFISDNFNQSGYYCPKCDFLDTNPCNCLGASIEEVNLSNALIGKIIKNQGEVEFLSESYLANFDNIAAKLRFSL